MSQINEAFTYCWTDKITRKLYVGVHLGSIDDGYICSCKLMLEEYFKRPKDFIRQILATGNYKDMIKFETTILRSVGAAKDPLFYNGHNGDGKFYNKGHSEETKKKLKIARNARLDKPREGKPFTEEAKIKLSKAAKRRSITSSHRLRAMMNVAVSCISTPNLARRSVPPNPVVFSR